MSLLGSVEAWDLVADGYASTTAGLFEGFSRAALELIPVQADTRVADIACGPGTLSLMAAESGAYVTAIDFSRAMLSHLSEQASLRGLDTLHGYEGDGQALPFADHCFDAAFSMFGLMFFPDRAAGFSEMFRTLKPGALACVSSWAPVSESSLLRLMLGAFQKVNPSLPDPEYDIESLENPARLRTEMELAGFRDVVVHTLEETAHFQSADQIWTDFAKGSAPIAMAKAKLPDEIWQPRAARAIGFIEETLSRFPAQLNSKAHLAVGRKP